MKDTAKPLKSIRQAILVALNTLGEMTVDGMLDQIQGFDRKLLAQNVAQLVSESLATRRKDVTGAPSYLITPLGKMRIKPSGATQQEQKSVVKQSLTTEQVKPVIKENLTTQSVIVSPEKIAEIEAAIDVGQAENGRLRAALKESEQVREIHAKSLLDLECEKIELLRENSVLRESKSTGTSRIEELKTALDNSLSARNHAWQELREIRDSISASDEESTLDEIVKLVINNSRSEKRISDLLETNAEIARSVLSSGDQQQVTVEQFLIIVPKRKPEVVKSFEKARQRAMSAAKSVGKVKVYAMVEVGHAVRGAVWNQTQVI